MKERKEIGTTSATSYAGHIAGHLHMTSSPAEKYEEHQTVGSICCPNCCHELTTELLVDFFKKCVDQLGLWKFEPSDQQLIDHLEAKINKSGDLKFNPLIDEFISTIVGEEGICYTHPDRLPGVTKDGTSKYFFHKSSMAYKTGTRKRRRIQGNVKFSFCDTRWHKTGKTKPVISNGILKGCKKILVLYNNFGKIMKPTKTNWIMHQYHLGAPRDEIEGEFVLSKIFYQTQKRQQSDGKRDALANELCETRHNNEARLEPRMQPEVCEAIGHMQTPPLDVQETPTQVSLLAPGFHLNAPSGPFTQFVTAHPMNEASGSLGNNYQLQNMPATSTYDQQQCHGDMLAATLEEIMGYTSADPNEGTSNAPSNEDWEFIDWHTDYTQDQSGSHG